MHSDSVYKYREMMEYLYCHKTARVAELASALFLSESTVRRALSVLERQKKLHRFHGGAALADEGEPFSLIRRDQVNHLKEKEVIGRLAASFVKEGMTLLLMGGTTVRAICPYLKGRRLTVITSSLPVVNDLAWEEQIQVIVLGGVLNPSEMEVRGGLTQLTLGHLRADMMFMGTTGLHPIHGVMTDDPNGVETYAACMRISDQVVVLADHTKCEHYVGTTVICGLLDLHCLIVDSGISDTTHAFYRENTRRMEVAGVGEGE